MMQLHAELDAVLRCNPADLTGTDLVVARGRRSKTPGMAKPCAVCQNILRRFGIKRVYYTTTGGTPEAPEIEEMRL